MDSFLLYIIKSTCCLILFYLGYKALLSRETFFRFNRIVLLIGILVCMLLPLVEIRTVSPGPLQMPLLQLEEVIKAEIGTVVPVLQNQRTGEVVPAMIEEASISWGKILLYGYFLGMLTGVILLLSSFISLLNLLRKGKKIRMDGYTLVLLGRTVSPFNWGRYIVLSEKDYNEFRKEILTHELVHLRERHSLDLIFAEVIVFLHWFNPAAWLLKLELMEIHEYQADKGVLQSGIDATKYQLLIVKKAVSASSYTFANSFNHSKIKKRITMMLKKQSNSWARVKLVLLIPVAACTLLAFARPDVNRKLEQLVQSEGTTISSPEQSYTKDFFDKEIDAYMEKMGKSELTGEEKIDFLNTQTHRVNFWINAVGKILYANAYVTMDEIPAKLKATFAEKFKDGKPIMIHFMGDIKTDQAIMDKGMELISKAFADYRATAAGKESPGFLYYGNPKNHSNSQKGSMKIKQSAVKLELHDGTEKVKNVWIDAQDDYSQICRKLDKAGVKDILTVSVIAPSETSMGVINDIKQALRNRKGLQMNYRVNTEL